MNIQNIPDIPDWFVVCMGLGTVFVGLICIIIICKIMGLFFANKKSAESTEETVTIPAATSNVNTENRQEILAAVCAVIAEDLGTDISAIKVLSFKKL